MRPPSPDKNKTAGRRQEQTRKRLFGNRTGGFHPPQKGQGTRSRRGLLFRGGPSAQDINQRLDRQFNEQERFGNQVVAPADGGVGAALEIRQAGDENDGGGLVAL